MMSLQNQGSSNPKQSKRTKVQRDSVDFCKIGGLGHHLKTLRELIIFPLLYSNVFSHFNVKTPRGILFYGPPGTGKTLVAAALATEINQEGLGKVAFFHRKGADILDKWVGGSEKNLRDLFEKASKSRPSIIFFDEFDGLAPVREKQVDQIHSSVVATLLALMDGLDNKPGVIVIGATNRIEGVDPALRRPGRFDKELYFPLPGIEARREILEVHTNTWKHRPNKRLLETLVDATSGFSGADLQALCYEAILRCLKRAFLVERNFKVNPEDLKVEECDFLNARLTLVPSSLKTGHKMRRLPPIMQPLLEGQLKKIIKSIQTFWPHFLQHNYKYIIGEERYAGRVLLTGSNMQGLNTHLVPAVLQRLEYLPAFIYDVTKIFKKNAASNAQHHFPSVLLLSRVDEWWNYIDDCEQLSIVSTLEEIHAGLPILVIATCRKDVPNMLQDFFYNNSSILLKIKDPTDEERKAFLKPLFFDNTIVSMASVLENSRKSDRKSDIKLNASRKILAGRRTRISENMVVTRSKRKRVEIPSSTSRKRIKIVENCASLNRCNSASSLYDIHKEIKQERDQDFDARKCDSMTSLDSQNRQCFTHVLSLLLSQKNAKFCADNENMSPLKTQLCDKKLNSENLALEVYPAVSKANTNDAQMQQIYNLWKHASLVTSKSMAVAQLELLYDVISACINIHWNSFESVVKNLEDILRNIEESYGVRK